MSEIRLPASDVRKLRARKKLSQVAAAEQVGISWRQWCRWEKEGVKSELGIFKLQRAGWL